MAFPPAVYWEVQAGVESRAADSALEAQQWRAVLAKPSRRGPFQQARLVHGVLQVRGLQTDSWMKPRPYDLLEEDALC